MRRSFLSVFFGLSAAAALAQYSIDWHTFDGSGGTSTGAAYSVSGTIGRPVASRTSGGSYTIDGGSWGIIAALQTAGAPSLSIALTTTNTVVVFWSSSSTGYVLQQNTTSITSVNWSNVVITPADDGKIKTIIENPVVGNRFYRLVRP